MGGQSESNNVECTSSRKRCGFKPRSPDLKPTVLSIKLPFLYSSHHLLSFQEEEKRKRAEAAAERKRKIAEERKIRQEEEAARIEAERLYVSTLTYQLSITVVLC